MSVQTLRYYERRGLLEKPGRAASGYREYAPQAVGVIRFIKRAQELGFALDEVKELIALRDVGDPRRAEVRALAEARILDIDRKQARLQAVRSALRSLLERCDGREDSPGCPIIEALGDGE